MGLIGEIRDRLTAGTNLADPAGRLVDMLGGAETASGIRVNPDTAMRATAVWACVTFIAETISALPLVTYKRTKGGKDRADDHPIYTLLHDAPNDEMTAMSARECVTGHALLRGNGHEIIVRDKQGIVRELWPVKSSLVNARRANDGSLYYDVNLSSSTLKVEAADMLHIHTLSPDGLMGMSPIAMHREGIGHALALQEYGARFFGNGARPGGVIRHKGKLAPDSRKNLRESWYESHGGLSRAHRVAILEEGMEWQQTGLSAEDAQYLETYKFKKSDIASIWRVPNHIINDYEHATYSNVEHLGIEVVKYTLTSWLTRWEQEIQRKLYRESERKIYFSEHLVDGLLRGDAVTRATALEIMRRNGIINARDWAEIENRNAPPGDQGSAYFVPVNWQTVEKAIEPDLLPKGDELMPVAPDPTAQPAPGDGQGGNKPPEGDQGAASGQGRALIGPGEVRRGPRGVADARLRLRKPYRRVLADAMTRVVAREKADVMRQAEKVCRSRAADQMGPWLDQFYRGHRDYVARAITPGLSALHEAMAYDVGDEMGADSSVSRDMSQFTADYVARATDKYTNDALASAKSITDRSLTGEETLSALDSLFQARGATVPAAQADHLMANGGDSAAMEMYRRSGAQAVQWHARGNCPECAAVDGQASSLERATHSPLHAGCVDCTITSK